MKVDRLLNDVNISTMVFSESSSCVTFEFLNMTDGASAGSLVCDGLRVFRYLSPPGSGLPVYVGEVNHALVPDVEARPLFQRLGYNLEGRAEGVPVEHSSELHYVCIDGGLTIEIVCTEVRFRSKD
jgi:hypothetical protein